MAKRERDPKHLRSEHETEPPPMEERKSPTVSAPSTRLLWLTSVFGKAAAEKMEAEEKKAGKILYC